MLLVMVSASTVTSMDGEWWTFAMVVLRLLKVRLAFSSPFSSPPVSNQAMSRLTWCELHLTFYSEILNNKILNWQWWRHWPVRKIYYDLHKALRTLMESGSELHFGLEVEIPYTFSFMIELNWTPFILLQLTVHRSSESMLVWVWAVPQSSRIFFSNYQEIFYHHLKPHN